MPPPPRNDPFRREIITILALKAILIYGLWYAFFSQPPDRTLTGDDVGRFFLGNSPPRIAKTPQQKVKAP